MYEIPDKNQEGHTTIREEVVDDNHFNSLDLIADKQAFHLRHVWTDEDTKHCWPTLITFSREAQKLLVALTKELS